METFDVTTGDLILTQGTFATLSGRSKIQQDLAIANITPYGSNNLHPRFGSVLPQYIGQPIGQTTKQLIYSEVNRVINNYNSVQLAKAKSFIQQGLQSPYGQDDLIQTINSIDVQQSYDTFYVTVTCTTMAGTEVSTAITVAQNSTVTSGAA